mmetsp:Transcript_13495/g.38605  ORF Transcript_13495/g.38605 Transcript_13495/m.38605 type:complete len:465 (-) Transcript_13495:516-1910(-)
MPANVDDADPVVGRVGQDGLGLSHDGHPCHEFRVERCEGGEEDGVVGIDRLGVGVDGVAHLGGPVRQEQDEGCLWCRGAHGGACGAGPELIQNVQCLLQRRLDRRHRGQYQMAVGLDLAQFHQIQSPYLRRRICTTTTTCIATCIATCTTAGHHWHHCRLPLLLLRLLLLESSHLLQQSLRAFVVGKVRSNWIQQSVELVDQTPLEVGFGNGTVQEGRPDGGKIGVGGRAGREGRTGRTEDDVLDVVEAGILEGVLGQVHRFLPGVAVCVSVSVCVCIGLPNVLFFLRLAGTVGRHDLALHVLYGVLHKHGGIGIALGHLFLPRLEAVQHVMAEYDGLALDLGGIAILPGQHVDLALIDAQLTNVGAEEEDVGALHEGVEDLGGRQTALHPSHDLAALFDPRNVESAGDVEHGRPVAVGVVGDLVGGPLENDVGQVHPGGLPNFDEVVTDDLDLGQVAAHLVVH